MQRLTFVNITIRPSTIAIIFTALAVTDFKWLKTYARDTTPIPVTKSV